MTKHETEYRVTNEEYSPEPCITTLRELQAMAECPTMVPGSEWGWE